MQARVPFPALRRPAPLWYAEADEGSGIRPEAERMSRMKIPVDRFDDTFAGTLYEQLGGADVLARIVHEFYSRVHADPELSPIFPDDLLETERKQFAFLSQFFGGPPLFAVHYGPPRLRARHLPFPITPARAHAWLRLMDKAMDEAAVDGGVKAKLMDRLTRVAFHMVNTPEAPASD